MTTPPDDASAVTAMAPADPLITLKQLRVRCTSWHQSEYETVTDKLRDHLAECQKAVRILRADKKLLKAFYELCEGYQIKTKGNSLFKIVVMFMFGITGPRASAWARAVEIADRADVPPERLPAWIKEQGGIESVRRNFAPGQSPGEKAKAKITETWEALESCTPICTIDKLSTSLHRNSDLPHSFCLALLRHDPAKNTGEVVWGTADDVLIQQFLLRVHGRVRDAAELRKSASKSEATLAKEEVAIRAALQDAAPPSEAQVA